MTSTTTTRLHCDVVTRIDVGMTIVCGYQYDHAGRAAETRKAAAAEGWSTAFAAGGVEDRCPTHSPVTPVTPTPTRATA